LALLFIGRGAFAQVGILTINLDGPKPAIVANTLITDLRGQQLTTDPNSRLELLFPDGTALSVAPSSSVSFPQQGHFADLDQGALFVATGEMNGSKSVAIGTPTATVQVDAASALVDVSPSAGTRATLSEGQKITLSNAAGSHGATKPGMELSARTQGEIAEPVVTSVLDVDERLDRRGDHANAVGSSQQVGNPPSNAKNATAPIAPTTNALALSAGNNLQSLGNNLQSPGNNLEKSAAGTGGQTGPVNLPLPTPNTHLIAAPNFSIGTGNHIDSCNCHAPGFTLTKLLH
jgi:hypothetical protein